MSLFSQRTASRRGRMALVFGLGLALCGATLSAPSQAAVDTTNLVVNPTFERSTDGWAVGSGIRLLRSATAHSGIRSAQVVNMGTTTRTVALNDAANTVASTTQGTPVTATAWVRVDKPGASVGVRLMEYSGSSLKGQATGTAWLTGTGWQQVSVTYVPVTTGASLDLNVLGRDIKPSQSIWIDDVAAHAKAPAPTAPPGWTQVWSDEFSAASVDSTVWNVRDSTGNSNEASYLLARNVTQANGVLSITAKREAAGGRQYTSGYLDTIGKKSFGVGTRWEIRAKVPTQEGTSGGLWPAFWLRSNQGGGEIDVAEFYGSPHPKLVNAHRNVDHIVHEDTMGGGAKSGVDYLLPNGGQPSDGYHLYAVEVLEDGIHFYVDGVKSHTVSKTTHPWIVPMLDDTWNVRMNFQVGKDGSWATAPTSTTQFPAKFEIDHIRVYQR